MWINAALQVSNYGFNTSLNTAYRESMFVRNAGIAVCCSVLFFMGWSEAVQAICLASMDLNKLTKQTPHLCSIYSVSQTKQLHK